MILFEKYFSIVSYYISFYFEYINLCKLCNKKHKFSIKGVVFIGIISIINYLLTLSGLTIVKIIFSFLSVLLICRFMVKEKTENAVVSSIIYYLMIIVIEYLMSLYLISVLKYNPDKYLISAGIQKCILGHIMSLITYIVCSIKIFGSAYKKLCNLINRSGIKKSHVYYFLSSLFIIQMMYTANIAGKIEMIYAILYVGVFITFLIYLTYMINRNNYLKMLNQFLEEKDSDMQKAIDEYRLFQHNIKNDLIAISSVSNKKVKEMIKDFMESYHLTSENLSNISSMPKGLRGVIYQKIINNKIIPTSIIVDNYIICDPMDTLNIKEYRKLVESFGIVMDNALEAAKSENDLIYIYIYEDDNMYKIRCTNTFNKLINVDKLMVKGESTKKGHLGLGMYFIKNKTNFDYNTKIVNNMFINELIVKK